MAFNTEFPDPINQPVTLVEDNNEVFTPNEAKFDDPNDIVNQYSNLIENDVDEWGSFVSGDLNTNQNAIAEIQGFRDLPQVINDDEFIELSKNPEYEIMYRGIEGSNDNESEKFIKNYMEGDLYGSTKNLFGNGTYFAGENQYDVALDYAANKTKNVFPALIKKSDMKIGDYTKLHEQYRNDKQKFENDIFKKFEKLAGDIKIDDSKYKKQYYTQISMLDDFGSWATAKGYDAYTVKVAHLSTGLGADRPTNYIVSLNRTKVIVSKTLRGRL